MLNSKLVDLIIPFMQVIFFLYKVILKKYCLSHIEKTQQRKAPNWLSPAIVVTTF